MTPRTSLGQVGRPLLGVTVFARRARDLGGVGASRRIFLVPPASEVLDRAWHIWPTRDFLADVAASLRRLAVGFAIGAESASRSGSSGASLRRARSIRSSSSRGRLRPSRSSLR